MFDVYARIADNNVDGCVFCRHSVLTPFFVSILVMMSGIQTTMSLVTRVCQSPLDWQDATRRTHCEELLPTSTYCHLPTTSSAHSPPRQATCLCYCCTVRQCALSL